VQRGDELASIEKSVSPPKEHPNSDCSQDLMWFGPDLLLRRLGFQLGQAVAWTAEDDDVPRGSVGWIMGCTYHGVTVRFPRGTWNFSPGEIMSANARLSPTSTQEESIDELWLAASPAWAGTTAHHEHNAQAFVPRTEGESASQAAAYGGGRRDVLPYQLPTMQLCPSARVSAAATWRDGAGGEQTVSGQVRELPFVYPHTPVLPFPEASAHEN